MFRHIKKRMLCLQRDSIRVSAGHSIRDVRGVSAACRADCRAALPLIDAKRYHLHLVPCGGMWNYALPALWNTKRFLVSVLYHYFNNSLLMLGLQNNSA